jgi:hypothetical protein
MKKVAATLLITALLPPVLLAGCGPMGTQTYNLTDFTNVDISSAFRFEIVQSDSYGVSVTAPEPLFNSIHVTREGETLRITMTGSAPLTGVKAKITMPDLRGLELSGAVNGTVKGFSSSHNFNLNVSGASHLSGNIVVGDAALRVSGASNVQLDGSAKNITIDVSGASTLGISAFPVNDADVTVNGASNAAINVGGRLDADLSGASRLTYAGEPTLGDIKTSGSSTLIRR